MKTAVCISGLPRGLKECSKSILDNIILPNNADVFIHSWFNPEKAGSLYRNRHPAFQAKVLNDTDKLIIETYNPKKVVIENQKIFDDKKYFSIYQPNDEYFIFAIQSMLYSIQQCGTLKAEHENLLNFKYDAVCRIRFDLLIKEPIYFNSLNLDYVNIKMDCTHKMFCCNDHIAVSNSKNMDVYFNTYSAIEELYRSGTPFSGETLLGDWLFNNGIKIIDGNFTYSLLERT
jgi:hypothetical protein